MLQAGKLLDVVRKVAKRIRRVDYCLQGGDRQVLMLEDFTDEDIAALFNRSVPKQIEYWSRIGKMAEENPDLPFGFIQDALLSKHEADTDDLQDYQFG